MTPEQEQTESDAREHYQKGQTHYNLGQFDAAAEEFKRAYELSSAPGLLFNIAQVYRAKEDYKQALYFYRTFLRLQPDAPNRADVRARIADLEKLQAEKQRVHEAPPRETIPPGATTPPPSPTSTETREAPPPVPPPASETSSTAIPASAPGREPPHERDSDRETGRAGRSLRIAGLATASVGVALVATGVVFGVSAAGAADELTKAAQNGTPWSPTLRQTYDDGQSAQTKLIVLAVAGGAAAIGGGVLYYLGWRRDASATQLSLAPLPSGGSLVVACRF